MSITDNPTYKHIDDDFEQYSFPSAVNPKQVHYIEKCDREEWELCLVQREESMSRKEVLALIRELEELLAFMDKLNRSELHRNTEPGQPAFEEVV